MAANPTDLPGVDEALLGFLTARASGGGEVDILRGEIERVVRSGGKRLRPAFCVWGYRAGGGSDDDSIARVAGALELLHTFAIIHDDVMDRSPLRRGSPTTHRWFTATEGLRGDLDHFGEGAAILAGDLAMALADELWWSSGFEAAALLDAVRPYHAMRAEVIGGQYLDLLAAARGSATPEETRAISVLKSGRYTVERPLEIGAALSGAHEAVRESLRAFGAPLGEAFQLRDDVLGAFGDPGTTGKPADSDLREGKQTLLIALARKAADPQQAQVLSRLGDPDLTDAEADAMRDVLRDTGALEQVLETIDGLLEQSYTALARANVPREAAEALDVLARDAVVREV
ncbi:MAG TPA: polyprenyl synthetase family protein [Actinomycetota bacterium]